MSSFPGPDWGFKPHPQAAAAYTSMSLLSSFLLLPRATGAAVKMQGEVCVPNSAAAWSARCSEVVSLPAAGPNPSSTCSLLPGLSWGWCQGTPINQTIIQQILPAFCHLHLQFPLTQKWPIFANKTVSISPQVLLYNGRVA